MLFITFYSTQVSASDNDVHIEDVPHDNPALLMIAGAGVFTWWIHSLGDTPEDGRRNVKILWGSSILGTAGIVLYQKSKNKGLQVKSGALKNGAYLSFNYRY